MRDARIIQCYMSSWKEAKGKNSILKETQKAFEKKILYLLLIEPFGKKERGHLVNLISSQQPVLCLKV